MKLNEMTAHEIRKAVADKYGEVAKNHDEHFEFPTGRNFAIEVGYPGTLLNKLPEQSVSAFAGASNTILSAPLKLDDFVLDVGSGAGMDSFIAAERVGLKGKVVGIDSSKSMIEMANKCKKQTVFNNVEFIQGFVEELPISNEFFDIVVSNGIFNLSPDKKAVADEIYRVLKPHGTLTLSEIVLKEDIPREQRNDLSAWFR